MSCQHHDFEANVTVNRLEDPGELNFMADVTVACTQCRTPFRFLGLPIGLDLRSGSVSVDGTQAHLAIAPKGETVRPLKGVEGYTIRRVPSSE